MVGPKRSSTEPAYVDMTLVLKSLQPEEVPRMEKVKPVGDRQAAIPQRYKDREALEIMNQLDEPYDGDIRGQVQALDRDLSLEEYMAGAFDPVNFDDALNFEGGDGEGGGAEEGKEDDGDKKEEEEEFVEEDEEEEELGWGGEGKKDGGKEDEEGGEEGEQQHVREEKCVIVE